MEDVESRFTVFFGDPFWVGVFERYSDGRLAVCKVVFGAEPKDSELHEFVLKRWNSLKFSEGIAAAVVEQKHINPKRMQRLAHQETLPTGIGTKAQQALKHEMETKKKELASSSRMKQELQDAERFKLRQQKNKEKHRGR